ncbi:hypothetical protein N9A94_06130 [Akkermansiaceae bacterium]|nr:hypothetical protein [Akkermansiaceae bacterium]
MANPGTPVIPPSTSYSISLWAKRDASGVNGWLIGQGDTGAQRQSLHIGFRNNGQTAHAFWSDDLSMVSNGSHRHDRLAPVGRHLRCCHQ